MKLVSLEDQFATFLEEPTCAGFLRVREQLIADEDYVPHSRVIDELTQLVEQQRANAALAAADELMPSWGLCPRVHFLAGQAAEMLGDADEVELRRFLVSSCLAGIIASGRGTWRAPWLATYPTDIHDVLTAKRLTAKSQLVVETGSGKLLRVIAGGKRTVWFDVGEMFAACEASRVAEFATDVVEPASRR